MKKKKFDLWDHLIPGIITILISISVVVWLKLDSVLPHWDMGRHLFTTLSWKGVWYSFFHGDKSIFGLLSYYPYYPPLIYNIGWPFFLVFGRSADAITYSNIIWLAVLIFSVYHLSRIYFNKFASTGAVLFILAIPMIIGQMREFQTDMPLTAAFAFSLFWLLKSDLLQSKTANFFLGVSLGLGMMTKWSFVFFAAPAFIVYFIAAYTKTADKKRILKNTLIIFAVAFMICGAWYTRNMPSLIHDFKQNGYSVAVGEGDPVGFNRLAWTWYWKYLFMNYLTLPLSLFAFGSFVASLFHLKKKPVLALTLFLLIFCYAYFSYLPNKDIRYIMPAMVPLAFLVGFGINCLKNKYLQLIAIIILGFFVIVNNATVSFAKYLPYPLKDLNFKIAQSNYGTVTTTNGYTATSPRNEFCSMDEMAKSIPETSRARLVGSNPIEFNIWATAFYLTKNNRIWSEEQEPDLLSDYLFFRNDQESVDSFLERKGYSGKVIAVSHINCTDGTAVYTLKVKK